MRTSWVELCVSNLEESIAWFREVLGFESVQEDAHFARLEHGETVLLLAAEDSPYWSSERARLPTPGKRGGGVEIVLLVNDVETLYRRAQDRKADIVRPLERQPWRLRQFWVRHPDGFLLRPAERVP